VAEKESSRVSEPQRSRTVVWKDPRRVVEASSHMSGIELLRAIGSGEIPPPPMAVLVGLTPVLAEEGRVIFALTPAEVHYNTMGVVHGGAIATLVDTALGCAVMSKMPRGTGYTTVELHLNFVRPVTAATGRILCEALILHSGSRMATAEAKVRDESGKLYAHASTTCFVFPLPSPQNAKSI
jgi:uncharacterized protein (TIGR00369 family)